MYMGMVLVTICLNLQQPVTEDVDKEMNIMFQRCKRDLNISFMSVVRGSRDRQNELFAEVSKVHHQNVNLLEKQVILICGRIPD